MRNFSLHFALETLILFQLWLKPMGIPLFFEDQQEATERAISSTHEERAGDSRTMDLLIGSGLGTWSKTEFGEDYLQR